jgi:hypothetical protein
MFAKVCAAGLVLVTLAACGSTAPKPAAPVPSALPLGPAVPVTAPVPADQLALPFDRYRPNFAEESEIQRARTILARVCLRERGVRLDVPDDVRDPGVLDVTPNLRRYGVIDETTATRFGYHFPRTAQEKQRQQDRERWSSSLTEDQRMALFGEGGCTEQADTELTDVDDKFFVDADFQSLRTAKADQKVVAATAAWRACMAEQGFDYPDPDAAIGDPRWDLDAATPSAAETDTALADVRCKTSSRLVDTWHDIEVGVQQEVIRRDVGRFAGLMSACDERLAAARRVLAS